MLSILNPAPFKEPSTDQQYIKQQYRYWRIRLVASAYLGYVFFYFTRKTFTFAMPFMQKDLGFTKSELGIIGMTLYMVYGLSKFLSGILSDRSNPRYFMSIGLMLTGVFNILFGSSSSLTLLCILWGLNGVFQAWGFPPCAKILTHWYTNEKRGFWWSFTSTSHNVGGAIIPIIVAFLAMKLGWRFAVILPGIMSILMGLFLMFSLRDVPQSLGLPNVEDYESKKEVKKTNVLESTILTTKQILLQILTNPLLLLLAFSYSFVYFIRIGVNDWTSFYLIEAIKLDPVASANGILLFEGGGFCGMLFAGFVTDYFFKGNRLPYILLTISLTMVILGILWKVPLESVYAYFGLIFVLGFSIFGPHLLIGLAAAELVHKYAAGTANGFVSWFGYIGAAATGFPLGYVIDNYSWNGFFITLIMAGILNVMFILPIYIVKRKSYPNTAFFIDLRNLIIKMLKGIKSLQVNFTRNQDRFDSY